MLLAIAGALLPILFVVGLGWLAARTGAILQPALLLGAALTLGVRGPLVQEVFLLGVLPSGTLIPALAHSNKAYESEAPMTAMASTLFSILSISAGIAIAKAVL